MKVELGAPIIVVPAVETLWHIPVQPDDHDEVQTLCGLTGTLWSYAASLRERRCCFVCRRVHRYRPYLNPFAA